ncbi:MAG: glycosyltransferase family 25 protein [Candidatus Paceibacterota bacterium]|jgi:glycosyl transferase family 25
MNFQIFVINLPIDIERRKNIEKRLHFLGAKYEIMNGIYGDDERVIARYDNNRAIKEHGKPLIFGEKGCALAHILVYERIIKENISYAVILEDDILLPDNFLSLIEKEIAKKNKNWDWLSFDYRYSGLPFLYNWFSATYQTIKKRPTFFFYACLKAPYMTTVSLYEEIREIFATKFPKYAGAKRFYRPLYNAGAYILTLDGAKKLLPFTNPLRMGADTVPNKARFKTNFNLYGYVPLVVSQNLETFGSNTVLSEEEWAKIVR